MMKAWVTICVYACVCKMCVYLSFVCVRECVYSYIYMCAVFSYMCTIVWICTSEYVHIFVCLCMQPYSVMCVCQHVYVHILVHVCFQ